MDRLARSAWLLALVSALASCWGGPRPGARECVEPAQRVASAPRAGRLRVTTVPAADVWIDGVSRGVAPVEVSLPAGEHAIRARLGGFAVHESRALVAADALHDVTVRLTLLDPEEREGLQLLGDAVLPEAHRLWVQVFEAPRPTRGEGEEAPVRVLYPRGAVRPRDLARFRIEFAPGTQAAGAVEFRRGDAVLHRQVVTSGDLREIEGSIPVAVRDALAVGDRVSWGFYPAEGAPRTGTFEVVQKDLQQAMAAIGKAFEAQPAAAGAHMRAQLLLDQGLYYAAHQEAQGILAQDKGSVRAWAVVLEALERMGVGQTTQAWRAAQSAIAGASKPAQAQIHYVPGGDLQRIGAHLERGEAGRAVTALRARLGAGAVLDARQLQDLAQGAARSARAMGRSAPGAGRQLLDELRALTTQAAAASPGDEALHWAAANLHVAEGRLQALAGGTPGAEPWIRAAGAIEPLLAQGPQAAAAHVQAVQWLHEAAALGGTAAAPALARARVLARQLATRFPERSESALAVASTALLRAKLEPRMARKELQIAADECLDALQPHLATENPAIEVGTLHTRAVTLCKERKLRGKAEYRTVQVQDSRNLLRFELPLSASWNATPDPLGRYIVFIRNLDETGALQRVITVQTYEWFTPYRFPDGRTTNGENAGALAKFTLTETLAGFDKVKRKRDAHARKLSRRFPRAYHTEVRGERPDGSFLRLRSWTFKSDEHQVTYHLTIQDLVDGLPAGDPELDFVIHSLADLER